MAGSIWRRGRQRMAEGSASGGVARSADELAVTLAGCRRGFELRQVRAAETDQWSLVDGALQHRSRGFFSVNGVDDGSGACVLLYQPQAAVTGIVSAVVDGERRFLLQGRAEPGCLGEAQFGPTVQSTPANFMRLHGGATTPYVDAFIAFDPDVSVVDDTTQLDLGERYCFKSKRSILVETRAPSPPQPAFFWATPAAIIEAVSRSAFLNIDLRSILSITRWSATGDDGELTPRSEEARRSLAAPLRPDVLGALAARIGDAKPKRLTFIPLDQLADWQATEWGWSEVEPRQGFSIDFFEVAAASREVARWIQPLVNSATDGHVALACRERGGALEVFVRVAEERGLATSAALSPSYVRYPGAPGEPPRWLQDAEIWSSTVESDEGGRFYRDASRYELVRADDVQDEAGAWVRLSELKAMLRVSNACTIQLRGVVSQLLAAAGAVLGICVVYLVKDADGEAILDFSFAQFARSTRGPYRIYGCAPDDDRKVLKRIARHGATVMRSGERHHNPSQEHSKLLDMLVDQAVADGCDHVVTFDMDSWPIIDGWDRLYAAALSDRFPVASIARTEIGHNFPFAAFTFFRAGFWRAGESSFTTRQRASFSTEAANVATRPGETGGGILARLHEDGLGYLRLERSNVWDLHAIMAAVYDNTIFHVGAGSRSPRFMTDDDEHGLNGSPFRRAYADQINEARRSFTVSRVLKQHDAFMAELAGADRRPLAPIETEARGVPKQLTLTPVADRKPMGDPPS